MPKPIAEFRRPEILRAAFEAIRKGGLPLPSYDQIAQEADMSRQLIRHYFPNPEELMVALCDMLAAAYRDSLIKGVLAANSTERLATFLDFYFGFLEGRGLPKPADDQVYDAMFALAAGSPRLRRVLHDQYNLLHHTVSHEIQISNPSLHPAACDEIGFLFVALMYGHWKMVATLGMSESYNRVTREAMDRIIASYLERYTPRDEEAPGSEDAG